MGTTARLSENALLTHDALRVEAEMKEGKKGVDREQERRHTAPQLPQVFPPSLAVPHLGQSDPCILALVFGWRFGKSSRRIGI